MPEVSILMNAYNSELYLEEAINSIYSQTFSDWEIIFIYNCSIDQTSRIAHSYDSRLKYFKTDKNISLGAARNFGLKFVKGKYLTFLDTDDLWESNKLEDQLGYIRNSNHSFIYSSVKIINPDGLVLRTTKINKKFNIETLLARPDINMHSTMINLNIQKVSFNDKLFFCPDLQLFMSIVASGGTYLGLDIPLIRYRIHPNSLSKETRNIQQKEVLNVYNMIKDDFPNVYEANLSSFNKGLNKVQYLLKIKSELEKNNKLKAIFFLLKLSKFNIRYLFVAFSLSVPILNKKITNKLINHY